MRRVLRTQRRVTWISAAGRPGARHLDGHCLVRVLAEELEARKTGGRAVAGRVGGPAGTAAV